MGDQIFVNTDNSS